MLLTEYTGTTSICEVSNIDDNSGFCPTHVIITIGLPGAI